MPAVGVDIDEGFPQRGGHLAVEIVEHQFSESEDGVERGSELVAHAGEKLRFGPAGLRQTLVEAPQLGRRRALLLVEALELPAHPVHVLGERAELIAVGDSHRDAEIPRRNLAEELVGPPNGKDERPGDDEPEDHRQPDRQDGEPPHHEARAPVGGDGAGAEARHARLLRGDHLSNEPIDRPVERLLAGGQRVPGVVDLALADGVRDVRHHRHRVVLRRSDLLDQRALVGRRRRLDAGERVVEAVVLAKDLRHRRFVLAHERHRRVVHLERERVLDLL